MLCNSRRLLHVRALCAAAFALFHLSEAAFAQASHRRPANCTDNAMIVFDASGSMSGMLRTGVRVSRIDQVRAALEIVLPQVERHRNIGLIVYGPEFGADGNSNQQCRNISLRFPPIANAARRIISEVNALVPSGVTPLTDAIALAAEELRYRENPAVVVLFTDGQETCGGVPCRTVRSLLRDAAGLTVHVINYSIEDPFGIRQPFGATCIADETGGLYVPVQTLEELVAAFRKTLDCPALTEVGNQGRPPGRLALPK